MTLSCRCKVIRSLTVNLLARISLFVGMGWIKRKGIAAGSVYLVIKNYKDDEGNEHVDADQTVAGIAGNQERRTLLWKEKNVNDPVFGWVNSKSRRISPDELEEAHLKEGWTDETKEHGVVHNYASSDTPKSGTSWIAIQVWGVEVINGERRYVR